MESKFISIADTTPIGFEQIKPSRQDLLGSNIALFANSLEQAFSLIDNFENRVGGVIITIGNIVIHQPINSKLIHFVINKKLLPNLKELALPYLILLSENQKTINKNRIFEIEIEKLQNNYKQTKESYNTSNEHLVKKIEETEAEITTRKKIQLELRKKNDDYLSLIEELKASEEELRAVNEELVATNDALKESEERFKRLTENAKDMIYRMSLPDGVYEYASPASINIWGYTPKEIYNSPMHVAKCIHPDWEGYFKKEWAKLLSGDLSPTYEYQIIDKNGNEKWLNQRNVLVKDTNNKPIAIEGIVTDITERKKNEIELLQAKQKAEESELMYRLSMEAALQGAYQVDAKGYVVFANALTAQLTGYLPSELLGLHMDTLFSFEETKVISDANIAMLSSGKSLVGENKLTKKDGSHIEIYFSCAPLHKNGKYKGFIGSILDITERKKTEQELIKAKQKAEESDLLKTEFLNNMSHEIRTPLNGILGFSKLLNNPDLQEDKTKFYTDIIENSGKQLMQVIDDILEISRLETKQVKVIEEEVNINNVLLHLFSIFDIKAKENKTPLYFKKALTDKQSTIYTDKTKLNKILSNLLENALKFTSTGYVEIGYKIKMNSEPVEMEIYVKDTGIGIEKEKQEIIFDRFSQVEKEISQKVGGLGLGLSIAKENIAITQTFVSEEDINIVLIVEDEEINLLYIDEILEQSKFEVKTIHAKTGKEAIEICKQNKTLKLVLMDLKLPEMNGFEATKRIKKLCPDLPIVAQTAYSTKTEKEKALQAGCDDFISKPIDENDFYKIIEKYLV